MDDPSTPLHRDAQPDAAPRHANAFAFSANFPVIRHIDDVRPHIRPESGIKIHRWGRNYIGINYAITAPETFQTALDLECRGLVFDRATGALCARAVHKFFQAGERQTPSDLDFSQENWVEKKLDGSMIAAFVEGDPATGEVVFYTRGGFSSQARAAHAIASAGVLALVRAACGSGLTPIFEWTSPDNRMVLAYSEDALTLLAARDRMTGIYVSRSELEAMAGAHGVGVVAVHAGGLNGPEDLHRLIADVRGLSGEEGVVLAFADGHRIKIKAEDYLRKHKILADLASEKNAQKAWVAGSVDDIAALLDERRGERLRAFGAEMDRRMLGHVRDLEAIIDRTADLDAKDRAQIFRDALPKPLLSAAFAMAKGADGMDQMRRLMAWGHQDLTKMAALRDVFDLPEWSLSHLPADPADT